MKFMTYNIRKGLGPTGRGSQTESLADAIASRSLDLLLCQEVFHQKDTDGQSKIIGETVGLSPFYRANKHRRVGHHGNAMFTHLPVEHVQNFDISMNAFERRGALYTRMSTRFGPMHVFNLHLSLTEGQRKAQIRQVQQLIYRLAAPEHAVVIAGDFNDWNGNLDEYVREKMGFVNVFGDPKRAQRTWPTQRPLFNLDRVYTRHLRVEEAICLDGDPWTGLSDHLPLYVELAPA